METSTPQTGGDGSRQSGGASRAGVGREPLRILFAVPFSPRFDTPHGGRVTAQLLRSLLPTHRVALVYLRESDEPPADPELAAACELVEEIVPARSGHHNAWRHRQHVLSSPITGRPTAVAAKYTRLLPERLLATARRFAPDVIQVEHDVIAYCGPVIRRSVPVTVLVNHDPGLVSAEHLAELTTGRTRLAHRLDARVWRRYWRATLPSFATVVTFSDQDREVVRAVAPGVSVETIALGIDLPPAPLSPTGAEESVAFVGGYDHIPNADAAVRLLRSIMPSVRANHPHARLVLVGARPTAEMRGAAGPLDEVTGWVDSVRPHVDTAAVIALPIRIGGGMRVKLLEALAAGKAIVASSQATAGLALTDGQEYLLADSDAQFAAAVAGLLEAPERRADLGSRARAWAEANLGWGSRARLYHELYDSLLRETRGNRPAPPCSTA